MAIIEQKPLPTLESQKIPRSTFQTIRQIFQNISVKVVEDSLQSYNFLTGVRGWKINSNGDVEFSNGVFRGSISASTIDIGGADTSSFHVDVDGNMWAGAATFNIATNPFAVSNAGVLRAVSGIIAGWNLSTSALSTGAFDTLNTMYFGTSGLSLSNVFKVTSAGALTALSGVIGGFTLGATEMYGGIIKTAATVSAGNNGVIMDSAGLRGYDSVLGKVFDIHTDGSAPEFAFGNISNSIFEINTNAILRTSATVGDGSASSAGILINDTGLYATEANQTLANANVKILIDGSAVIKMNVKGGQTDFNTGIGYFLGLSGGDYKLSIGNPAGDYMNWDGGHLKLKGSFDVGIGGLINNSVYTVANLPVAPTSVGFNVSSAFE